MKNISEFEDIIGYSFTNVSLLETALTHSSYVNENRSKDRTLEDNERFEFFGDAIIEFYVSEYLFNKYETFPEGDMTKLRASMVCEQSLAECARQIKLGAFMRMGKGEERTGGRERASVTSDAFEALVAAIYLDSKGTDKVRKFIYEHLIKGLKDKTLFFDAKTKLQEIVQQDGNADISYEILSETGPAHNKMFEVAVVIGGEEAGRGKGHSKKAAHQQAAEAAIARIEGTER